jgi:hypothetical protein
LSCDKPPRLDHGIGAVNDFDQSDAAKRRLGERRRKKRDLRLVVGINHTLAFNEDCA